MRDMTINCTNPNGCNCAVPQNEKILEHFKCPYYLAAKEYNKDTDFAGPSEKLVSIPADAHSLEVFSIKESTNSPTGKEAFIGFKIANGNFHFVQVPYTGK